MKHFKVAKRRTWLYGFTHRKRFKIIIDEFLEYCMETDPERTLWALKTLVHQRLGTIVKHNGRCVSPVTFC